jgi:hypothetical protein
MKWKEKYATKNVIKIQRYYNTGNGFTVGGIPSELFKPTKEATRKEFKRKINHVEKLFAIVPDSIRISQGRSDSIYINKYKIRYLKKNHLKTNAMIFKND